MSNERLTKVLAAVGLSEKGIDAREENTIIVEAARKAKATHLVGGADASQTFVEVKQWLSLSIVLVEEDLEKIDQGLISKSYLVGNSFTVADAAIFVAVSLSNYKASVLKFSELRRWFNHVQHVCSGAGFEIVNIPTSSFASVRLPPFKTGSITSAAPANIPIVKPEAAAGAPAIKAAAAAAEATKEAGKGKEKEEKQKGKKDDTKGEKKADASAAAAAAEGDQEDLDPSKLDIRVGHVVKCWNHPDSEKLLCEEIDLGEGTLRTIASGIRPHYAAEELQGRKVCVLANLKDRNLAGFKSQGMVLCAVSKDHSAIKLVEPPSTATIGERITFPGFPGEPASASQLAKKKILEKLAPQLHTDSNGVAQWSSSSFTTAAGVCTAQLNDAVVS